MCCRIPHPICRMEHIKQKLCSTHSMSSDKAEVSKICCVNVSWAEREAAISTAIHEQDGHSSGASRVIDVANKGSPDRQRACSLSMSQQGCKQQLVIACLLGKSRLTSASAHPVHLLGESQGVCRWERWSSSLWHAWQQPAGRYHECCQ